MMHSQQQYQQYQPLYYFHCLELLDLFHHTTIHTAYQRLAEHFKCTYNNTILHSNVQFTRLPLNSDRQRHYALIYNPQVITTHYNSTLTPSTIPPALFPTGNGSIFASWFSSPTTQNVEDVFDDTTILHPKSRQQQRKREQQQQQQYFRRQQQQQQQQQQQSQQQQSQHNTQSMTLDSLPPPLGSLSKHGKYNVASPQQQQQQQTQPIFHPTLPTTSLPLIILLTFLYFTTGLLLLLQVFSMTFKLIGLDYTPLSTFLSLSLLIFLSPYLLFKQDIFLVFYNPTTAPTTTTTPLLPSQSLSQISVQSTTSPYSNTYGSYSGSGNDLFTNFPYQTQQQYHNQQQGKGPATTNNAKKKKNYVYLPIIIILLLLSLIISLLLGDSLEYEPDLNVGQDIDLLKEQLLQEYYYSNQIYQTMNLNFEQFRIQLEKVANQSKSSLWTNNPVMKKLREFKFDTLKLVPLASGRFVRHPAQQNKNHQNGHKNNDSIPITLHKP